ncbi:MAG: response regulator, partial [Bdellovibrionota bacterium]
QATPLVTSSEVAARARTALENIQEGDKTILIVEDDDKFRGLVADATEGFGLKPIVTGDGEVALAILEQHAPSAVLLDIKLPGISGLGLLEIIKRSPRLRHIPTHMMSALEHQQNALRSGAMGYLTKPVTIDKVKSALTRIEGLLSRQVKRLLIVEDDQHQQEAIRHLVEGKDIEIESVRAGDEALKAMQSRSFDCVILDLSLPDMSGLELLDSIESLNISVPPIVVYTGRDLSRDEIKRLKTVSGSIIIKGAKSPERLLDEVNLFLHRVENNLPQDKRHMLEEMRDRNLTFEGQKALVVDDDLRNIFALTHALESKGFEVESAVDGVEAIKLLEQRSDIDVILMDIMMPKMDGFEATRRIRKMKSHAKTPIIALTAKAMKGDHENCIAAGASDYLPKPVNLSNLFSVLKVWLQNKGNLV